MTELTKWATACLRTLEHMKLLADHAQRMSKNPVLAERAQAQVEIEAAFCRRFRWAVLASILTMFVVWRLT